MLDENIEKLSSEKEGEETKSLKNTNPSNETEKVEVKNVEEKSSEKEEDTAQEVGDVNEATSKENIAKEKQKVEKTEEVETVKEVEEVGGATNEEDVVKEEREEQKVEKTEKVEEIKIPIIDYAKMELDELVGSMQLLLNNYPIQKIKDQFETLRKDFTKKFKGFVAEKKAAFLADGGEEANFSFTSIAKNDFNALVKEFKQKRQQYYRELERSQQENLDKRLQLIDKIKDLIDNAEASTMYKKFRELQEEWRNIGQIPHAKYNDVWKTYHHHVERFYDLLHLNNDFRDLDFKHNLEEKTKLVEKAEALAEDKDVHHAFKELQILHRLWKEDIGPVAREFREDVWNRFSEATKKIHNKRQELQDQLESKYLENVDLKLAVIEKIKNVSIENITSHKAWQDKINELEKLRDEFFAVGRVPKSKNEEIWQKFKDATKSFNKAKNNFYKSIKKDQLDNLDKKMKLVEQAESLKDSEDWDTVTEVFKRIQSEWKKIGHVPRKDSDKIWKQFKDACNHYFDRLHQIQDNANKGLVEVFNQKKELLSEFKTKVEEEAEFTIDLVNSYIENWKGLGAVPDKMRHIEGKFSKVLDHAYKKLNMDKNEVAQLKFQNTVDSFVAQNDSRKLYNEQLFVRRKIDEITKEIKQLENNISFISNATEDNPLVKNVYKSIEKHKEQLQIWQDKLNYLKKIEI